MILCTPNEDKPKIKNKLKLKSAISVPAEVGITDHAETANPNAKIGANIKIKISALFGKIDSFNKSFNPSAIGWNNPKNPTIFGPWRRCKAAKKCLSYKVKNAIDNNNGIIKDKKGNTSNTILTITPIVFQTESIKILLEIFSIIKIYI